MGKNLSSSEGREIIMGLSDQQRFFFRENGYLLIENFFSKKKAAQMTQEIDSYLKSKDIEIRFRNQFFPNSADPVFRFVYSPDDLDKNGEPKDNGFVKYFNFYDEQLSITNALLFSDLVKNVMRSIGFIRPRVGFIDYLMRTSYKTFENDKAHIEDDHVFTQPPSTVVFWFNFSQVAPEQGCLWVLPGGHKRFPSSTQLVRDGEEVKYRNREGKYFERHFSELKFDRQTYTPITSAPGDLVLIDGLTPHIGDYNLDNEIKKRLTIAVVEGSFEYPPENFVYNNPARPFPYFY